MRPLPFVLALLAVSPALAGCVLPAGVRDLVDRIRGVPDAFLPEIAMQQPSGGGEPNVAVLPDGKVFITAVAGSQERPNFATGAAWLWKSADGGKSWETLRAPQRDTPLGTPDAPNTRRPFGSSDADVATSPDGWVYYTDWWNWGSPIVFPDPTGTLNSRMGNYLVEASKDGGSTWTSTSVTGPDASNIDRQWIVPGEGGFVMLAYNAYNMPQNFLPGDVAGKPGSELRVVTSTDHGAHFLGKPSVVAPYGADVGYVIAHPFVLPKSKNTVMFPYLVSPWSGNVSTPGDVVASTSTDLGKTWKPVTVAKNVTFETIWPLQGAVDAAGNVFLAWNERRGERMVLVESQSTDAGATWSAPRVIVDEGTTFLPWVAATGTGRVAIGAYFSNATGDPTKAANETAWRMGVWESSNALAPNATFLRLFASDPVKKGPLCPTGAACASNRELLDYVGLAYGPDFRLHAAWATSRPNPAGPGLAGWVHYAGSAGPRS